MSALSIINDLYYSRSEIDALFEAFDRRVLGLGTRVTQLDTATSNTSSQGSAMTQTLELFTATADNRLQALRDLIFAQLDTKVSKDQWPGLVQQVTDAAQQAAATAAHRAISEWQAQQQIQQQAAQPQP